MQFKHKSSFLSHVIFCLFQVIDVGSGKGYLCSFLSVQFNLQVFGIDSSSTNTHGAQERNRKLKKFSKVYQNRSRATRNQVAQPSNNGDDKTEKHSRNSDQEVGSTNCITQTESCTTQDQVTTDVSSNKTIEYTADPNDRDAADSFFSMLSLDVIEDSSPRVNPSQLSEEEKERRKRENLERKARDGLSNGSDDSLFSPLTSYVTAETELETLITELEVRGHLSF